MKEERNFVTIVLFNLAITILSSCRNDDVLDTLMFILYHQYFHSNFRTIQGEEKDIDAKTFLSLKICIFATENTP